MTLGFIPRLLLCALMMLAAFWGAYANRARAFDRGSNPLSFLFDSENFNDFGKFWRIVCLVSFLALVGVVTMKSVAILFGGPLIDLDQFG
ncbi:hypothetical protein [Telmatospirillum siberiense]|nr:hypothetical protein [Telmatospirillum siberiense]